MKRYFIRIGDGEWQETGKDEWIKQERSAGFVPRGMDNLSEGYWTKPATGGFSTSQSGGISGRIIDMDTYSPSNYAWDKTFPVLEV